MSNFLVESYSQLEHLCRLQFDAPTKRRRLTTIICTIGKASRDLDMLTKMMMAGMSIVRLNFSHDPHEVHAQTVQLVRQAAENCSNELGYNHHVAIAMDLTGPEIRTGLIEGSGEVELRKNENIRLSINKDLLDKGNREVVFVDYPNIINVVQAGKRVFINDGAISLVVKEVAVDCLICQVETGGMLGSRKNVSLPGVPVDLPPVSEKDRFDIKFGLDHNIDIIFATSTLGALTVQELRSLLGEKGKDIKIISKIENEQALQHLDEIIASSDGILVARADLAVELTADKIFLVQKAIIARCNKVGKPVICATQILESMRNKARPTRAEVADLGNAVLDGADCVMLSSESAIGRFPLETVTAMASICREAESALWYHSLFQDLLARNPASIDAAHAIAISAVDSAKKALASAIVILTTSGRSAHLLSRYRPRCPILAVTRCTRAARQLNLHRGIIPIVYIESSQEDWTKEIDNRVHFALLVGRKMGFVDVGDSIIVVSPWKDGPGFTNNMRLVYAFFENEPLDCLLKSDKRATSKLLPVDAQQATK